ncbi:DUF6262 family protein [Streptomyces sp. NPDC057557]|uniref:DUF6262 family protein n=1 Tax=Streptomyces sp. NPDC057557 TaxID=3346167 RepID=UPI0036B75908
MQTPLNARGVQEHEPRRAGDRRVEALRKAARDKREQAVQHAENGIRRLIKENEEITFRSVARAAGVSLDFLYAHADLRRRIETLRSQEQSATRIPAETTSIDDGTADPSLKGQGQRSAGSTLCREM